MARIVKKSSERRAEIVQTARDLFQKKEYSKVTMQDVMDRLGIAKGTIYYYFDSKEEIFEAVIEDMVDKNIAMIQEVVKKSRGNALQKMRKIFETSSVVSTDSSIIEELHRPGNEAMHTRLLAVTLMRLAPLYAKVIEQGCEEGIFKTRAPLECAEFILSGAQFLTDLGIYPWTQQDLLRRAEAIPHLMEQMLCAAPGSFQFLVERLKE